MKACWSCGTETPWCESDCECAKCVDPEGYAQWKRECPEEYDDWLERQMDDDGDN